MEHRWLSTTDTGVERYRHLETAIAWGCVCWARGGLQLYSPARMSRNATKTRRAILIIGVCVYAMTIVAVSAYRARVDQSSTSDFDDFWNTGRHFLQTRKIVEDYGVHNYLPFFVISISPFGLLPIKVASVLFSLGSIGGFILSVRLIDRWVAGAEWGGRGASTGYPSFPFLRLVAPIGMTLPYITGCLVVGQMSLYTLVMLVFMWNAFENRRPGAAGFWLALAISTKVYPTIWLAYFLLKRSWKLIVTTLIVLVVMNMVIPSALMGPRETLRLSQAFWERSVQGQSAFRLAVVASNKMSYANQSSALVARRLSQPTDSGVDKQNGMPRYINLVNWCDSQTSVAGIRLPSVAWVLGAFVLILLGLAFWICRHPANKLTSRRMRHEFAAFVPLALLLSPVVWSFYYAVCYLPLSFICSTGMIRWQQGHRWTSELFVSLVWWFGIIALAIPLARMCGFHLYACFVLFLLLLWMADREKPIRQAP